MSHETSSTMAPFVQSIAVRVLSAALWGAIGGTSVREAFVRVGADGKSWVATIPEQLTVIEALFPGD